jgi:hypothetical protein
MTRRVRLALPALIFAACGLVLLAAGEARARRVEVHQPAVEGLASASALKSRALQKAFGRGVYLEALDILPRGLTPDRRLTLEDYLQERAGHFVFGYEGISQKMRPSGLDLAVEVMVNREALRDCLEDLGLLSRPEDPVPIAVDLEAVGPDETARVLSLLRLSRFEETEEAPNRLALQLVPQGTELTLPGNRTRTVEEPFWQGSLATREAMWTARSKDLMALWPALMGRFFSARAEAGGDRGARRLVMSGWYASDGVKEFDRILGEWMDIVQESRLLSLTMRPEGIEAVWRITSPNPVGLQAKLDTYVASRGLRFKVETPEAQESEDKTDQTDQDPSEADSSEPRAGSRSEAGGAQQ